jgi:hypothetical protein
MSRIFIFILLIAAAVAQTAPVAKPAAAPEDENSRKARALIDQTIQALGGQAYLAAKTKGEEGRYFTFYHGDSKGTGIPFGLYTKFPDKQRLEILKLHSYHFLLFTVGGIASKDKSDVVVIHNADKAYEVTFKGTAKEDPKTTSAYIRRREHSLDAVLRRWINEPGVAFFYEGQAVAAEKPAEQVSVTNAKNDSVTLYLDVNTHLPIKTSYTWRDPQDKGRNVEEEIFDNYKSVQGVMAPHSVTRYLNGDMSYQRFLTTVTFNTELPDNLFEANITYEPYKGSSSR